MLAHWYRGKRGRNFGDALTEVLFRELAGIDLRWAPPDQAQLFGAGSILHRLPAGYTGTVYGTGFMFPHQTADLSGARVLALRGPRWPHVMQQSIRPLKYSSLTLLIAASRSCTRP